MQMEARDPANQPVYRKTGLSMPTQLLCHPLQCHLTLNTWMRNTLHNIHVHLVLCLIWSITPTDRCLSLPGCSSISVWKWKWITISVTAQEMHTNYKRFMLFRCLWRCSAAPCLLFNLASSLNITSSINIPSSGLSLLKSLMCKSTWKDMRSWNSESQQLCLWQGCKCQPRHQLHVLLSGITSQLQPHFSVFVLTK